MNIFVTGGGGFLGKNLIPQLQNQGHIVIAPNSQQLNLLDNQMLL